MKQDMTKFDEALGIQYVGRSLLKSGVNFTFVDSGRSFQANVYSGVKSKKINKSLFSIDMLGEVKDFTKVSISPALKMGTARYKKGYIITTDNGTNLFLPEKTKYQIEAKWKKWTHGKMLKKGNHQTGKMISPFLDGHRKAMPPGKRISKNGNEYSEYRKNRTDLVHTKEGDF